MEDAGSRATRAVLPLYRSGSAKQVILPIQFFIGALSYPEREAILSLRLRYRPTFSPRRFFIFYPWRSHIHSQITRRRDRGQRHSFLHGADAVEHAGQPDKRVRARLILAKARGRGT